eukprot:3856288-Karenia_brevis.AAC.1
MTVIMVCFQQVGVVDVGLMTSLYKLSNASLNASPPSLSISASMPALSRVFPFFNCVSACRSSSCVKS